VTGAPGTHTDRLARRLAEADAPSDRLAARLDLADWLADAEPARGVALATGAPEEADGLADPLLAARARYVLGHALLFALEAGRAYEVLGDARAAASDAGDPSTGAWARLMSGIALDYLGDPGGASVQVDLALETFRGLDDPAGQGRALNTVGVEEANRGAHADALASFERALELAEAAGDPATGGLARLNAAEVRVHLGVAAREHGREDEAQALFARSAADYERAAADAVATGFLSLVPYVAAYRTAAYVHLGRAEEARASAELALQQAAAIDDPQVSATAAAYAGEAFVLLGEPRRGLALLEQAHAAYGRWGGLGDRVRVLRGLVAACEAIGDLAGALARHKELLRCELQLRADSGRRETQVLAARLEAERARDAVERERRRSARLVRANRRLADVQRDLERLAHTDPLTGLANRRHFDAQLASRLVQAGLAGTPVSLLLLDLDHFKQVNDEHSHGAGDEVLRRVAEELAALCRSTDLAARIGGEEFAVLLADTPFGPARSAAERLRGAVRRLPLDDLAPGLRTTVSIGVATAPPGTSPAALVAAADAELYAAKRAGRDRVHPDGSQAAAQGAAGGPRP